MTNYACLENRLGRQLKAKDFSVVLLNFMEGYSRSKRLKSRMEGFYELKINQMCKKLNPKISMSAKSM